MADSVALRSARYRAHRANDHHLCRHGAVVMLDASRDAPYAGDGSEIDPAAELARLAGQLQAAYARDTSNVALARELLRTLQVLMGAAGGVDGELAEFLRGFAES